MTIAARCAALLLSLVATPALAAPVQVGDGTLNGTFLKPYENVWRYTATLPGGKVVPQGLWTDQLIETQVAGKPVMKRVQGVVFTNGRTSVTTNVFDPVTMASVMSERRGIDGHIFRRTFDGVHVATADLTGDKDTTPPVTADLPAPAFDFDGGMYGMLLVALPLKAGMEGTLVAIDENSTKPTLEPFKVLRQETITADARGKTKVWVVESEHPGDYKMTFWLSKNAPYIIKLVDDDTTNKRVLTWTML